MPIENGFNGMNQEWLFGKLLVDHILKKSSDAFQCRELSTRSKLKHITKNVIAQTEHTNNIFGFRSSFSAINKRKCKGNSK